jgi:hypothetical protein
MEENLFKTAALLIILYAVYHLVRLIRNIIEESRKSEKKKEPENH